MWQLRRDVAGDLTARDNELMRKRVLGSAPLPGDAADSREWLKLQDLAEVEVTSEARRLEAAGQPC